MYVYICKRVLTGVTVRSLVFVNSFVDDASINDIWYTNAEHKCRSSKVTEDVTDFIIEISPHLR